MKGHLSAMNDMLNFELKETNLKADHILNRLGFNINDYVSKTLNYNIFSNSNPVDLNKSTNIFHANNLYPPNQ